VDGDQEVGVNRETSDGAGKAVVTGRPRLFGRLVLDDVSFAPAAMAAPPKAPVLPGTDDSFGTEVVNEYRYFENLKDQECRRG
jgi:hypothetical protein